jgi:hypothetical protein
MRKRSVFAALVSVLLLCENAAHAAPRLHVFHTEQVATACPSEVALQTELAGMTPEGRGEYWLRLDRTGARFEASLGGDVVRILADGSCKAVARAALAMIALAEDDLELGRAKPTNTSLEEMPRAEAPRETAAPARTLRPAVADTPRVSRDQPKAEPVLGAARGPVLLEGGLGAGVNWGIGSEGAPEALGVLRVGSTRSGYLFGLGGRYVFVPDRVDSVGLIRRTAVGGWLEGCGRWIGSSIKLATCLQAAMHTVTATTSWTGAADDPRELSLSRLRPSIGLAFELDDTRLEPIGWFVRATIDIPVTRQTLVAGGDTTGTTPRTLIDGPAVGASLVAGGRFRVF